MWTDLALILNSSLDWHCEKLTASSSCKRCGADFAALKERSWLEARRVVWALVYCYSMLDIALMMGLGLSFVRRWQKQLQRPIIETCFES